MTSAITLNGTGTIESHTIDYLRGTKYFNGHRLKDTFWMKHAGSTANCKTAAATCANEWTYDSRDRLTQEIRHRGTNKRASVYELYAHDGIKSSKIVDPGTNGVVEPENVPPIDDSVKRAKETMFYSGLRLERLESPLGTVKAKYFYDGAGNLSCVTDKDGTKDKCAEYRGEDPNGDGDGADD